MAGDGAIERDRVESVIEAIQTVRPRGQRKAPTLWVGPEREAPAQQGPSNEAHAAVPARRLPKRTQKKKRPTVAASAKRVDVASALRRIIKIDRRGDVIVPATSVLPGFEANLKRVSRARLTFARSNAGLSW